jgi:hypothetical protein
MTLGSCSLYIELCTPTFSYSSKYIESLHCLLHHELMSMSCSLSLIIFHVIFQGKFHPAWVGLSSFCLLTSLPGHPKVQSSLCSKSMKFFVWSSRSSCIFQMSCRTPLGNEVVHSHYTPTWVFNILMLLLELWRPHIQPSDITGFLKINTIHVYLWFWDVDTFCIARRYNLYSYMTWICSVFYWKTWFISFRAWVCPPQRDNCYFCRWHLPNSSLGLTRFVYWWIFCNVFLPSDDLMNSHIRGNLL